MNPDTENKQDTDTKAKHEGKKVRQKHGSERKKIMELAIAGAIAASVILWIMSRVAMYKHRETAVIWTVYAAISLTLLVFFLTWQKRASERPKGAVAVDRPELSLEGAFVKFLAGESPELKFGIMNRGSLTAHQINLGGEDFVKPVSFTGPLKHTPQPAVTGLDIYPSLAAGAAMTATTLEGATLSKQEIDDIRNRKLLFLHYTKGRYEDEQGNAYPFDLCLMYEPGWSTMRTCPANYWPKDESNA